MSDQPRILVIRRDNIGDLVCTTPLIAGLRQRYPEAWIGVLANAYNAPVLERNPDVNAIFAYRKAKHGGISKLGVIAERGRLAIALRRVGIDHALIATPSFHARSINFARLAGARSVVGFAGASDARRRLDVVVPVATEPMSEVEDVYRLGSVLDVGGEPPPLKIVPDPAVVARAMSAIAPWRQGGGPIIGLHISARKMSQRWPEECAIEAVRALQAAHGASFLLFWSPGDSGNPTHPGDDAKAARVLAAARDCRLLGWPTRELGELIGAIAACDLMVMSDGGAMHIAAALGKPITCLFGRSDAVRWRPWGVPYRLLQPESHSVADVTSADVVQAAGDLLAGRARDQRESLPAREPDLD